MPSYSIAQARTQFSDVIDQAEERGSVEITRRGRRVAVLLSDREYQKLTGNPDLFERIMKFRLKYAQELDDEPLLVAREANTGRERNPWD